MESTSWNKIDLIVRSITCKLGFGAYGNRMLILESCASHSPFILLLLKRSHDLVLLDSSEVVFVSDAITGINSGLCLTFKLTETINICGSHGSL